MRIRRVVCCLACLGALGGLCLVGLEVVFRWGMGAEFSPMHMAVLNNDVAEVRRLAQQGKWVNAQGGKYGDTPLGLAVAGRHREIAELLIASGADLDRGGGLSIAGYRGDVEFATLLLKHGARVDGGPSAAVSPLFMAVDYGQSEVGRLLIAHGADVNYRSSHVWGQTVLQRAATSAPLALVALILEKGARVNESDDSGRTALHNAAARGRLDVVKLLIRFGAAREAVDHGGNTSEDLAEQHGHMDVLRFLLRRNPGEMRQ